MARGRVWARVVLIAPAGHVVTCWELRGPHPPDVAVVDVLARAQLLARRWGGSIPVLDGCEELAELLELAGLRREVGGEAEGGEEAGVEEGVEPGDAVP